ncbi:MAG: CopG family transcriptional regulator [Spirochaetes bacterium]|nr:CopG family transcriptional regulator [Spirochaetota bacterium]
MEIKNNKRNKINKKNYIISLKIDKNLYERLSFIEDKSNFIRIAILKALENVCPLCNGSGVLNENQKKHVEELLINHEILKCNKCGEIFIKCKKSK